MAKTASKQSPDCSARCVFQAVWPCGPTCSIQGAEGGARELNKSPAVGEYVEQAATKSNFGRLR